MGGAGPESLEEDHLTHILVDMDDLHEVVAGAQPWTLLQLGAVVAKAPVLQRSHGGFSYMILYDIIS